MPTETKSVKKTSNAKSTSAKTTKAEVKAEEIKVKVKMDTEKLVEEISQKIEKEVEAAVEKNIETVFSPVETPDKPIRGLRKETVISDEVADFVPEPEVKIDVEESVAFTPEQVQEGLNALKEALITPVEEEVEVPEVEKTTLNKLEDKHGRAGSRNALKIEKENHVPLGQRDGMFIGMPTGAYYTRIKGEKDEINPGKGAQKINADRPIKN